MAEPKKDVDERMALAVDYLDGKDWETMENARGFIWDERAPWRILIKIITENQDDTPFNEWNRDVKIIIKQRI